MEAGGDGGVSWMYCGCVGDFSVGGVGDGKGLSEQYSSDAS